MLESLFAYALTWLRSTVDVLRSVCLHFKPEIQQGDCLQKLSCTICVYKKKLFFVGLSSTSSLTAECLAQKIMVHKTRQDSCLCQSHMCHSRDCHFSHYQPPSLQVSLYSLQAWSLLLFFIHLSFRRGKAIGAASGKNYQTQNLTLEQKCCNFFHEHM